MTALLLTPAEHAEIVRQVALWPVCPTCDGWGYGIDSGGMGGREHCPDCVKGRNPPCFRYDHLRLGTAADNTADMLAKGRQRNGATA